MRTYFCEIGYGNDTFISTEIVEPNGDDFRARRFMVRKPIAIYFRLWIKRKVYVLSTNKFFEIRKKPKRPRKGIKILFGIQSEDWR